MQHLSSPAHRRQSHRLLEEAPGHLCKGIEMTHEDAIAAILAREQEKGVVSEAELRQQLADVTNERDELRASLKTMVVHYKNAVSTGYDWIIQLGGDCDSVARMLADNLDYAHAVGLLAQSAPTTDEQGARS
jgi:hypothetical protein